MYTLNCKGKLLVINEPIVMGIINATPDSFYTGELHQGIDAIVDKAGTMLQEGATILDIGGQSTRPGSVRISADEEIERVIPVISAITKAFPDAILSIDTYYSAVANAAVAAGASIVNDVSAGNMDAAMIATVAGLHVPYIAMHMQGTPETMQQQPTYKGVVVEVLDFFIAKTAECRAAGISDIIIDPGFGFGKTVTHNFQLLKGFANFTILGYPLLAGLSRKGTICKTLGITAAEALNGTTAMNTMALLNGASILRVHDVKEAMEAVRLVSAYQQA